MSGIGGEEHKLLAYWAADCAERVLFVFERNDPDDRPRRAIDAARAWARGEITISEARKYAFAAQAAARIQADDQSKAAARAAGHAVATAHVCLHAKYAASYARKACADSNQEREWQLQNIPENIKSLIA